MSDEILVELALITERLKTLHNNSVNLQETQKVTSEKINEISFHLAEQNGAIPRLQLDVSRLLDNFEKHIDKEEIRLNALDSKITNNEKQIVSIKAKARVLGWVTGVMIAMAGVMISTMKWIWGK